MTIDAAFDWTQPSMFGVRTVHDDGTSRLLLSGELDMAAEPTLDVALAVELEQGKAVVIDCSQLVFMDGRGARVLVRAMARARARGTSVRVVNASTPVRLVLSLSGLDGPLLGDVDSLSMT